MQYTIFSNFDKLKFIHGYEAWENWEKKSSWGSEMNNTPAPPPPPLFKPQNQVWILNKSNLVC